MAGKELLIEHGLHLIRLKTDSPIYKIPKSFVDKSEFMRILAEYKLIGFKTKEVRFADS